MYYHPTLSASASASAHRPVAACSLRVIAGERYIRIFPAGLFEAARGAMEGAGPWLMTRELAEAIIASAAARTVDIPIDYEHQILMADSNGQPAPAAGWIDRASLEWREGGDAPGLYGAVSWSPRAAQHIGDDEYRYLSPVFAYAPADGAVLDLYHVALTNNPAIETEALAAARSRYQTTHTTDRPTEETNMDLKKLLEALGLPADTSESDALAACAALKQSAAEAQEQVAALKATAGKPDPAKFVPVEQLEGIKTDLAALRGQMAGSEVDRLVSDGMQAGKLLPVQEQWAKELGTADLAALRSYLETTPAVAALNQSQTGGKPPPADGAGKAGELSESQMAICKAMGLRPEDYQKQLAASR